MNILTNISNELNITKQQVESVLLLLKDGATIPFISRYRKDKTGGLDEDVIRKIEEYYHYEINLQKRKEDVIRIISSKGLMNDELELQIKNCNRLIEVEDIYRPFKEKRKTKATEAIKNGLEPFAKELISFPKGNVDDFVVKYLNDKVKTKEEAVIGAKYIIAEMISDNAEYRKVIRDNTYNNGFINSKLKKNANDNNKIYEMYYDYKERVKYIKPHRILAINRGENEDILMVSIVYDSDKVIEYLERKIIKGKDSFAVDIVKDAIVDSYKRLIKNSIEREIRNDLTTIGQDAAILNFSSNLQSLLLTPPIKEKIVLALDPGFVNGCKLAVIDKTGTYLTSTVIKPFVQSLNLKNKAELILKDLITKYDVDLIAIGNGTASRESEVFVADVIKKYKLCCKYVIVSEAGASIYSVSKEGILEFPDLSPNERSAVSIGRRLQDPLSELVKIPPSGIGVGLYQHDVPLKKLNENLDYTVMKVVNSIGVNLNTASASLLKYVSGLTSKNILKIMNYKKTNGKFKNRNQLKKLLSTKAYEQAIGFLRIDGDYMLDLTSIHPESYEKTIKLLNYLNFNVSDIGTESLKNKLKSTDLDSLSKMLNIEPYTLSLITNCLIDPLRDPRDEMPMPLLKSDVLSIDDLTIGMHLQGTVRNVVDFGAFIDIGLHEDGLVHISEITDKYIKHPSEILSVGDIVDCYVIDIKKDKNKVSLSLKKQ